MARLKKSMWLVGVEADSSATAPIFQNILPIRQYLYGLANNLQAKVSGAYWLTGLGSSLENN